MNKFLYLQTNWLGTFDYNLRSDDYEYSNWFKISTLRLWPPHTYSRAHKLNTPWIADKSICPIPEITHNETNFEKVFDSIAEEFCQLVASTGRTPYLCFSGGIDSTSILVALLKVASPDLLSKLVILHDSRSVTENPYFFYKYIDKKLKTENVDQFSITADNYNKIIILDGEAGNQTMGHNAVQRLIFKERYDLLDKPWREINDLTELFLNATDFHINLVKESIKYAPIPIETGYDFLWWINFNFKVDDVLLRKILPYTANLDATQTKDFYYNSLYRFYAHPSMQIWSMLTKDYRRECLKITPKYVPKKYIYDFDGNDLWFYNKREDTSSSHQLLANHVAYPLVAIDENWHKYSLADAESRIKLGQLLKRI